MVKGAKNIEKLEQDPDVVVLIGSTGAGKTALLQSIVGHKLEKVWNDFQIRFVYDVVGDGEKHFDIGHTQISNTENVFTFKDTSTFYVDTPGFDDNRHNEIDIATATGI